MKSQWARLRMQSVNIVVVLAAVAVGHLTTGGASAQGNNDNAGTRAILAAIGNLQTALVALQGSVDALQGSVNTVQTSVDALSPPAQGNVLYSPIVQVSSDALLCAVTNVSAVPRSIQIQMVRTNGTIAQSSTIPLAAGASVETGMGFPGFTGYCKFTVVDGVKSDIRSNVHVGSVNGDTDKFAVAAE